MRELAGGCGKGFRIGAIWGPVRAGALAAGLLAGSGLALPPARAAAWAGSSGPGRFAVMGVRLYMTAAQATAVLRRQAPALERTTHACAAAPAARCTGLLRARVPDGVLTVRFLDNPAGLAAAREAAWRITLRLDPRQGTDPRTLLAGAEAHYGSPSSRRPLLWCTDPAPTGGSCAANRPRLRLTEATNAPSILRLSDPGLAARHARQAAIAGRRSPVSPGAPGG